MVLVPVVTQKIDFKRKYKAYLGNNSRIKISGAFTIQSAFVGKADSESIGVSVGAVAVGVALAKSYITPEVSVYIGTNSVVDAANISLDARYNIEEDGSTIDNRAYAWSLAPAGGIAAVAGADAKATSSPILSAYVETGTRLTATGTIKILARSFSKAVSDSMGIIAGGLAVGPSLSTAKANGSVTTYMNGSVTNSAGTGIGASSFTMKSASISTAESDGMAIAAGIFSGVGVDTEAEASPTIDSHVGGIILARNNISISSISEGNADAHALGVSVGLGIGIGVSLADAKVSPTITAYLASGSTAVSANGNISLISLHNISESGTPVTNSDSTSKGAYAYANSSGGGILSGNGADSDAKAQANVTTSVGSGSIMDAGGNISIKALSLNRSSADADGITVGLGAGIGASLADASSSGITTAALNGSVKDNSVTNATERLT